MKKPAPKFKIAPGAYWSSTLEGELADHVYMLSCVDRFQCDQIMVAKALLLVFRTRPYQPWIEKRLLGGEAARLDQTIWNSGYSPMASSIKVDADGQPDSREGFYHHEEYRRFDAVPITQKKRTRSKFVKTIGDKRVLSRSLLPDWTGNRPDPSAITRLKKYAGKTFHELSNEALVEILNLEIGGRPPFTLARVKKIKHELFKRFRDPVSGQMWPVS